MKKKYEGDDKVKRTKLKIYRGQFEHLWMQQMRPFLYILFG